MARCNSVRAACNEWAPLVTPDQQVMDGTSLAIHPKYEGGNVASRPASGLIGALGAQAVARRAENTSGPLSKQTEEPMRVTTYRDGRVAPKLMLWTWKPDHRMRFVLALWALGWSFSLTNTGVSCATNADRSTTGAVSVAGECRESTRRPPTAYSRT